MLRQLRQVLRILVIITLSLVTVPVVVVGTIVGGLIFLPLPATLPTPKLAVTSLPSIVLDVNGKTLDTCPALPIPQLVQVFERVASGLVHMHRCRVCHADLKPNNVMLSRTGDVKIIDFGLARARGEKRDRMQGTPEFMAPEQVKEKTINESTDIYNFGATMYRMVTGRLPPSSMTKEGGFPMDSKTWGRMFKPVQEVVPAAPPALCSLIQRCLAFNAKERPEGMGEVQGALDHLLDEVVKSADDKLDAIEW